MDDPENRIITDNSNFIADQQQQQDLLISSQDQTLNALEDSIVRIGNIALQINDELQESEQVMSQLSNEMDGANNNMKRARKKMRKIMKLSRNTVSTCTIVLLAIAVVILLVLISQKKKSG